MRKQRNIKKSDRDHRTMIIRKNLSWILLIVLIFSCYLVLVHVAEPRLLPMAHVKVSGKYERVDQDVIKTHISPYVKGFFSTDMMTIKQTLLQIPYVDDVVIKRIWPDTLAVSITEMTFLARWGECGAVNSKGDIIPVSLSDKNLPIFKGPRDQASIMLDEYQILSSILAPHGLSIAALQLNARHAWEIRLNNGLKLLLGRKNVTESLTACVDVLDKLYRLHGKSIDIIDLRYPNGVSVHVLPKPP